MTPNPTWHIDPGVLDGYVAGTLGRAPAASVEAHLMSCVSCRATMAPLVAPERLERNLAAITERVDQPRRNPIERILERLGVPEHISRVLVVTPSERGAWFAGIVFSLLVVAAAEIFSGSERTLFAFLVVAPLLPLAGVTAAITFRHDPLRELVVAVPMPGFKLFLMRALSVLSPTIAVATGASLLVPRQGWEPVLWLLPSFGLIATTLALGSWLPLRAVASTLGAVWVLAATITVRGASSANLIESYAAFRPAGQVTLLVVSLMAGMVVVLRRDSFDFVDVGRTS